MRKTMTGLAAFVAVMTVSAAAPAMACGYSSCASSCGGGLLQAFANPCGGGYAYGGGYGAGYGAGYGYAGYGAGYNYGSYAGNAYSNYDRLPSPQYYYVNQGPTYTGPGAYAPIPTYQERAVSGWSAYSQPYYRGYTGGRYANPSHHYYDGATETGPVVYRYAPRRFYHGTRPAYRPTVRYSYAPRVVYAQRPVYAPAVRYHAPRPHFHRHHAPILRRYN